MAERSVEGGCLCGAVRYRATGELASAPAFCHCHSCRLASGAPIVAWFTWRRAGFAWTRGEPRAFRSSPPVVRTFCGACGTPLTYSHDDYPETLDVTTVSLDDPGAFPPVDHVWTSEAVPWLHVADGLARRARRREDG